MDRARARERGQPLCMEQYYRLFTSYRYPGVERDSLVTSSPSRDEPVHIIVACMNQVSTMNPLSTRGWALDRVYNSYAGHSIAFFHFVTTL